MASGRGIEACLEYVAKKEDFSSYEFNLKEGTSKGDGYLGDTIRLDLHGMTNEGKKRVLHLFIKSSTDSSDFRKNTPIVEVFEREIFVYATLFKAYEELQRKHDIKEKFSNIPKFYGYLIENGREHVILEDLSINGYILHDRKQTMNLDHAKLIFKTYGRLHALSFALKDQNPDLFRALSKNYSDLMGKFLLQTNMVPNFVDMLIKIKKFLEANGDSDLLEKLDNYERHVPYILTMLCSEEKHDFVFLHGDCWNNNFMFKYEDGNHDKPIDLRIVDWQFSRMGSPVIDLSHYMYACLSGEELESLDNLFDVYYDSFADFLTQLGSDSEKLFPKHGLLRHVKKYGKYGIIFMSISLFLSLVEDHESPDLLNAVESGNFSKLYSSDIENQDTLIRRARNAIVNAVQNDLL